MRLPPRRLWYFVGISRDPASGKATLYQEGVASRYNSPLGKVVQHDYAGHVRQTFGVRRKNAPATPFLIAEVRDNLIPRSDFVSDMFAGKTDRPPFCARMLSREELDACPGGTKPNAAAILAHRGAQDGDMLARLQRLTPLTGHVQITAVPSRQGTDAGLGWRRALTA